ncbi:hypothetical protein QNI19_08745 [Cytophagaceae bacterium DM2B3-1]|uniref:NnrS family protein n=1 Tax=Xanthocytophaga flava TaxID=3048013 RepID=A0ABT7CGZ5_9BACT|nr:hypothetical protein [Xanthocytophaga flavus]MDJ1493018.1 hypothetical protein [Xanthocytophaga flavus]
MKTSFAVYSALAILPLALLSLLTGIVGGWYRLGWSIPISDSAGHHGLIMVGSFFGTLILLEKTAVLPQKKVLLLPFVNGLSLVFFLAGYPSAAMICLLVGATSLIGVCFYFAQKYPSDHATLQLAGSLLLAAGHLLLSLKWLYPLAVPYWIGFLLCTITSERLELTKFLPVRVFQKNLLWAALAILFIGILAPFHIWGQSILAIGMAGIGLWLLKYDMVAIAIRKSGIHRYSGILLGTGYIWLVISGILTGLATDIPFYYDALLHTFFVGFVFNMIFAHAPIILPSVLGWIVKLYSPVLYVWAIFLQGSLIVRILADINGWISGRLWAGMINGITIIGFFLTILVLSIQTRSRIRKSLTVTRG